MRGKKIPRLWYSVGENLSSIISTSCTIAAITEIKTIKFKKLKFTSGNPAHAKAPSCKKYLFIAQLVGAVIVNTNITAKPKPIDVSTFFEIAKKEHIPKKYANKIFSTKTAFVIKLR